jgi:hypothetical protein
MAKWATCLPADCCYDGQVGDLSTGGLVVLFGYLQFTMKIDAFNLKI